MEQAAAATRRTSTKRSFLKPAWREAFLLLLCAAVCSVQLFVRPYIGLGNNGDFGKVYARFSLSPPDGGARNFIYFVSDYRFDPQSYWKSAVASSENVLAGIPILLAKAAGARWFNIRWVGAVHLLLFLCAYAALLVYLRGFGRAFQLAIGALALFLFTDVAYVAYFNSFFSDTAALLGLLLMVPLALHLARQQPPRAATVWLFTAAALLFITSKTQHALWGIFPAAFLGGRRRFVPAALLVAAEAAMLVYTSPLYSAQPLFTVIFYKLAPNSIAPQRTVHELGLSDAEVRYIGTHAYTPGNPTVSIPWLRDFYHRSGYGKVVRYWLAHPAEAARSLRSDLDLEASQIRQRNLANYRQEDGRPPGTLARHFATWSDFRIWLYTRWPGHIVLWYALVIAGAIGVLLRRPAVRGPTVICLGICAMAILEFTFASLTDAIETGRHLFLFNAMTEVTVCFAGAWGLDAILRHRSIRSIAHAS
jgi:hypothetical protein